MGTTDSGAVVHGVLVGGGGLTKFHPIVPWQLDSKSPGGSGRRVST